MVLKEGLPAVDRKVEGGQAEGQDDVSDGWIVDHTIVLDLQRVYN